MGFTFTPADIVKAVNDWHTRGSIMLVSATKGGYCVGMLCGSPLTKTYTYSWHDDQWDGSGPIDNLDEAVKQFRKKIRSINAKIEKFPEDIRAKMNWPEIMINTGPGGFASVTSLDGKSTHLYFTVNPLTKETKVEWNIHYTQSKGFVNFEATQLQDACDTYEKYWAKIFEHFHGYAPGTPFEEIQAMKEKK